MHYVTYALCNNRHSIISVIFSLDTIRKPFPRLVCQDVISTTRKLPGNLFTGQCCFLLTLPYLYVFQSPDMLCLTTKIISNWQAIPCLPDLIDWLSIHHFFPPPWVIRLMCQQNLLYLHKTYNQKRKST